LRQIIHRVYLSNHLPAARRNSGLTVSRRLDTINIILQSLLLEAATHL